MSHNYSKIRELVSKHPEDEKVVLNDLIANLIKVQVPLGKLEVHNYKDSIKEANTLLIEQEKLVAALKHRLRNEVRPEVIAYHKTKPKVKRKMHPNSLKNIKNKNN